MVLGAIVRISAGTAFTLCVKNSLCSYALDNVRKSLQDTITAAVKPTFGNFVAPMVGSQLGTLAAIPVTMMLGEMLAGTLKRAITTLKDLFWAVIYGDNDRIQTPVVRDLAFGVASFAAGFFAKTYFCNYAMNPVGSLLRYAIGFGAPFLGASLAVSLLAPAVIAVVTPTATMILGDLLGSITSIGLFNLLDCAWQKVFNRTGNQGC